jgi:EAL and modified HD-GYP domain-containing signal transduction protein
LPICLQPIVDVQHGWTALSLRTAQPLPPAQLTRLFGELGLFEALGDLSCIVSVPDLSISDDIDGLLPAERIILRLSADSCRPENWPQLHHLRSLGFHLLADAFSPEAPIPPDIDSIAVDAGKPALLAAFKDWPGRRIAENVRTIESFEHCRQSGCQWLAGDYALHSDRTKLPRGGTRQALLMQLLGLIAHDADSLEIEQLVKQDANLSYQLLKLVNSVAFSLTREISSFSQAITLLGRRQLQRWLQLLLYARSERDDARSPLLPRAALRAALMEALVEDRGNASAEHAFMVGMFSLLDRLLGGAMADILAPLHLPAEVKAALISRSGLLGACLGAVEAADAGDCSALTGRLADLNTDADAWTAAVVRGYHWAIQVSAEA